MSRDLSAAVSDRTRFYLENRASIDRWHALRQEACSLCEDLLGTVYPLVSEGVTSSGWQAAEHRIGRWRLITLAPVGAAEGDDGTPLLAVSFEWTYKGALFDDPASAPYIGIRVGGGHAKREQVRTQLLAELKERSVARDGRPSDYWPLWSRCVAAPGWWDRPEESLERMIGQFLAERDALAEVLTAALGVAS